MGLPGLSAKRILLIALVTAALLALGGAAYAYLAHHQPAASWLRAHPDVRSFRISRPGTAPPVVTVQLGPVPDLARSYEELRAGVSRRLGDASRLVIQDQRSAELEAWWAWAHVAVEEGIATGGFVAMRERLASLAAPSGIDLRLAVAPDLVFVHAVREESYLYAVMPRGGASR